MKLCLLHANCQGEPLARLLYASAEFRKRWRIKHVVNYSREPVERADLARCELFLYQNLGDTWGELSSPTLLRGLMPGAKALMLPNLFFKGYWPLWTNQSSMNFGDICLDYLIDRGLEPAEAVHLYLKEDVVAPYGIDDLVAESMSFERSKEAGAVIELAPYVELHWREKQLFATVNHPHPELMRLVANAVLQQIGLEPLPELEHLGLPLEDLSCDPLFELPIHPVIGRHFGLNFATPERTYPAYGARLTFFKYALAYADCRKKGLNLLEYLQGAVD